MYLASLPNFQIETDLLQLRHPHRFIVYGCLLALAANPSLQSRNVKSILGADVCKLFCGSCTCLGDDDRLARQLFQRDVPLQPAGARAHAGLLLRDKCAAHFPFTVLNYPWVARIGVYSYAMYLIHHIVINVIEKNARSLPQSNHCSF